MLRLGTSVRTKNTPRPLELKALRDDDATPEPSALETNAPAADGHALDDQPYGFRVARLGQNQRLRSAMGGFHVRLSGSLPLDIRAFEHGRQFEPELLRIARYVFPRL